MLKDIVVSTNNSYIRHREFNFSTNCISSIFIYHLNNEYDCGEIKKIIIDVSVGGSDYDFLILDDVLTISCSFDMEVYWGSKQKKLLVLNLIKRNMIFLAENFNWDVDKIKSSCREIELINFNYYRYIGNEVNGPDKTESAQLAVRFEIEFYSLIIFIFNANEKKIKKEIEIIRTDPHEFIIAPYLGKISWSKNKGLLYTSKDKSISGKKIEF